MTRHDPAEAGPSGLGTCGKDTTEVDRIDRGARPSCVRWTGQVGQLSTELLEAIGPALVAALVAAAAAAVAALIVAVVR